MRTSPLLRATVAAMCVSTVAVALAAGSRVASHPRHPRPQAKVLDLRASEVRRVVVTSGDRRVELVHQADGSWSSGPGAPSASKRLMADVQGRLLPLGAYRTLPADTSDPGFGLVEPEITFRAEDGAGHGQAVLLGALSFTAGGVYARRDDDPGRIYLVPRRMMDDLRSLLAGQRIDASDDLAAKVEQFQQEQAKENAKQSGWLEQVLEAGVPLPEGLK